jgi:hypothetical protein
LSTKKFVETQWWNLPKKNLGVATRMHNNGGTDSVAICYVCRRVSPKAETS